MHKYSVSEGVLQRNDEDVYCPFQAESIGCGEWCAVFHATALSVSLNCCNVTHPLGVDML